MPSIATDDRSSVFASIVVPTYNRPDMLSRCLDLLERNLSTCGREGIEVIVTDNSTNTETRDLLTREYPWAKWLPGPGGGPASNRNSGVRGCRGTWIVFVDDDCLPGPGWLAAYLAAFAAAGEVKVFEGRTVADREVERLDEESPTNVEGGYLWACNMAIRRDLFDRIGGFCELFRYGHEDVDLRLRLQTENEAFVFLPDAVVCHPIRRVRGLSFTWSHVAAFQLLVERHPGILGDAPWRSTAFNFLRRAKGILLLGLRVRFRGIAFAAGRLFINLYSEIRATLLRNSGAA